jgi:GTP cyclohydrolase I
MFQDRESAEVKLAVEGHFREILHLLGEDISRPGIVDTPKRVAKMYCTELFKGMGVDLKPIIEGAVFEGEGEGMVVVGDIPFYSFCEHHLIPFFGKAYIGYIPQGGKVVGLSKIARVVEAVAKQPQVQERMSQMIANTLFDSTLAPEGVGVVITAEHLCMSMRGITKPGSKTTTCDVRGSFRYEPETRAEFLSHVDRLREHD